jgi:signal peptidase I
MKPTIMEGDLVAINKLAYDFKVPFTLARLAEWSQPANGDIVVFFSPKDGMRLVKRIVASPGDTIEMRGNVLFLNGRELRYTIADTHPFTPEIYEDLHPVVAKENDDDKAHWVMALPSRPARRDFPPVTVPPGKYFMMGDSRDNSFDSRFFGFVDRKQIVGRASRVIFSLDRNHYYIPRIRRSFSSLDA